MYEIAVIHGRFQILHNDHLKYLLAGFARSQHLVIGITNPDPWRTKFESTDPSRNSPQNNPLTYFQRYQMIEAALVENKIAPQRYSIVPFPINFPELYKYYLPTNAVFLLTIYDEWGKDKLTKFQNLGLKTEVMWEKKLSEKGITASEIRAKISNDEAWESLVPKSVAHFLKKWDIKKSL